MDVWRVNLREQSLKREPVPETWERLGGRGLSARILLDEVPATCEPLGRNNKLVLAPGLIVGHMLSSCDRISFGAKSPMTRGIKEANAGGSTGLHMTNLGMKALILEDQCTTDGTARSGWWVLHLSLAGARFEPADDVAGLGVHEAAASAPEAVRGQGGHRADRAGRRDAALGGRDPESGQGSGALAHRGPRRTGCGDGIEAPQGHRLRRRGREEAAHRQPGSVQGGAEALHEQHAGASADQDLPGVRHAGHGADVQRVRRSADPELQQRPVRGGRDDQRGDHARPAPQAGRGERDDPRLHGRLRHPVLQHLRR